MSSAGADIPSEVIDHIVSKFRMWHEQFFFHDIVGAEKNELGNLSLTCKHWARRCRPHLFSSISIRNKDDLLELLSLVDSSAAKRVKPSMLQCLQRLDLSVEGPPWPQPWLHLAHAEIIKRKKALQVISPEYIGDLNVRSFFGRYPPPLQDNEDAQLEHLGYAPLSWCTSLPRSLPSFVFRIQELELSCLRFRAPTFLIRLLQSVHSVQTLKCKSLQFDDWPEASYQLADRLGKGPSSLCEMSIQQCGSVVQDAELLLFVSRSQLRCGSFQGVFKHFTGWDALRQIVRSILQPETSAEIELRAPAQQWSRQDDCSLSVEQTYYRTETGSDYASRHAVSVTFKFHPPSASTVTDMVRSLYFDFTDNYTVSDAQAVDWTSVEEAALALQPTKTIGFITRSLSVFLWLLDAIPSGKILAKLYIGGKMFVNYVKPTRTLCDSDGIRGISLGAVLAMPIKHTIDGQAITLNRSQLAGLALCEVPDREDYLRGLLAADLSPSPGTKAQACGAAPQA
ncbi:hypothetical protein PHLGIDRAFT_229307 [Phlebiopsis gigantea 11061_1 CR5-6]|uniref:Uncharacterized protein n=1 Tax=Phlebiopsis gigantea (strain 11061_1 CR5-6) TaxID=745531 RepID=A0A0C3PE09_PHLG1|nr:hypothetical protein PHLGIDRAFT_229307 [Phlebiopsis gigantea 11061_1 CR5-6]